MNQSTEFETISVDDLLERALSQPDSEGVTLSGGEPFEQPLDALALFLVRLRKARDSGVVCYTGFTLEELLALPGAEAVLAEVDLLIDGPYLPQRNHGLAWRGSDNQRFHFLTRRYETWQARLKTQPGGMVEIDLDRYGRLELTGIPRHGFMEDLADKLSEKGIGIRLHT